MFLDWRWTNCYVEYIQELAKWKLVFLVTLHIVLLLALQHNSPVNWSHFKDDDFWHITRVKAVLLYMPLYIVYAYTFVSQLHKCNRTGSKLSRSSLPVRFWSVLFCYEYQMLPGWIHVSLIKFSKAKPQFYSHTFQLCCRPPGWGKEVPK